MNHFSEAGPSKEKANIENAMQLNKVNAVKMILLILLIVIFIFEVILYCCKVIKILDNFKIK